MKSTFQILFYVRINYVNKKGETTIMVRITLDGQISQFSSKLKIKPESWDTKSGKAVGNSASARLLNSSIENIRASIIRHYREIEWQDTHVTVEKIRNAFLGVTVKSQMLLVVFKNHNDDLEKRIGKDITEAGVEKYKRTRQRLADFMMHQYKIKDIALKEINYNFIRYFETYLRSIHNCGINTTAKYLQQFKHIITLAKNNGWLQADPFVNFKIRFEKADRGFLLEEELELLMRKKFAIKRLELVRDIFVFSCFTGLAYVDVRNLRKEDIRNSFDGKLWIDKKRQKTNVQSKILLLDIPRMILEKYDSVRKDERLLPVNCNQRINSYLKEIADLCGIKKNLTFHLARHTFATTITLAKGVPIETVSKMLGHTSIRTTQIYARITDSKISNDMQMLSKKLQNLDGVLI
ncbi:Site-specific recombinase XerD [Mariniphaga anaerophila]|uniref:Site-specific recombinase XerD n=1 Tax=Mariniphaga anaerophila TaxID=1484053 RepID=A0A1M4U743_9BACT|nr:site-specific integrase [Mariniphaga anaerophila]SHE52525.1 Site-specific recombinase XerD [Mariniphaga anaerophila]